MLSNDIITNDMVLTNYEQIKRFNPDIAIISNPSSCHIEIANYLASLDVHLLVEKPLSNSLLGVQELIDKCLAANLILQVGYNLRFSQTLNIFRNLIHNEAFGFFYKVNCVVGQNLLEWRPGTDYREGVSAKRELGGGVLLELSHEIDYLIWIFGSINWVKGKLSKESNLEIDVEDTARFEMNFHEFSNKEFIASVSLDFVRAVPIRRCKIFGISKDIEWDGINGTVRVFDKIKNVWITHATEKNLVELSFEREWDSFLDCIIKNKAPLITGLDGLKVIEIVDAIRKSSEKDARVDIVNDEKLESFR